MSRNPDRRLNLAAAACLLAGGIVVNLSALAEEKKDGAPSPSVGPAEAVPSSAVADADIIKFINEQIRKGWADAEITPSPAATENEWCRRLFLDVLGRVPSVAELE